MNRTIKFRAFHKTWRNELGSGMQGVKGLWWGNSGVGHVHLSEWADSTLLSDVELMQFTGLLDKNGKEIYEGDIVPVWTDQECTTNSVVTFKDGGFAKVGKTYSYSMWWKTLPEVEVIGNIYENSDLLV